MRQLEQAFCQAASLSTRSEYKIFYGQVHAAPILTLGINPGGSPTDISPDGTLQPGSTKAAASANFYENDEHDVLDCEWRENFGLRQLLFPLVGNDPARFRAEIVKTNLAFRRSARKADIDIDAATLEAAPYLQRIIEVVSPRLVVLTGVPIEAFTQRFAKKVSILVAPERDPGVRQVVFAAARVSLLLPEEAAVVVQVAHASQFAWTYSKYKIAERTLSLLRTTQISANAVVGSIETSSERSEMAKEPLGVTPARLVEAARYLESVGLSLDQLRKLHHSQRNDASFATTYSYFTSKYSLLSNNLLYGARLVHIEERHRAGGRDFAMLVNEALELFPLKK